MSLACYSRFVIMVLATISFSKAVPDSHLSYPLTYLCFSKESAITNSKMRRPPAPWTLAHTASIRPSQREYSTCALVPFHFWDRFSKPSQSGRATSQTCSVHSSADRQGKRNPAGKSWATYCWEWASLARNLFTIVTFWITFHNFSA